MIVPVQLKEGVSPDDYERWVLEDYAPAVRALPAVSGWRNYRETGLLGSDDAPPYRYVVTLEVEDLEVEDLEVEDLGRDMSDEGTRRLLSELHGYTEVTQLVAERFA